MQKFIKRFLPMLLCVLFIVVLFFLPDRFAGRGNQDKERCFGEVVAADDGTYRIKLMNGTFEGMAIKADSSDNYKKGDTVVVDLSKQGDVIEDTTIQGYERVNMLLLLIIVAVAAIVICLGLQALKGILLSLLVLVTTWKLFIPWTISGENLSIRVTLLCAAFSFVVFSMFFGFGRRFLVSFFGSLAGILVNAAIFGFFTDSLALGGMTAVRSYVNLGAILLFAGMQTKAIEKVTWIGQRKEEGKLAFIMLTALLLGAMSQVAEPAAVLWKQGATLYEMVNHEEITRILLQMLTGMIGVVAVVPASHFCNRIFGLLSKCEIFSQRNYQASKAPRI